MQIVHDTCCGIDAHAKTVVACLIQQGRKQTRTFSTMTADLLKLLDWLMAEDCRGIAIENTGVYWRPVFNTLEGQIEVMLVNARRVKAVPGARPMLKIVNGWLTSCVTVCSSRVSFGSGDHFRDWRKDEAVRQCQPPSGLGGE